jgi:hypothetical protein
LIYTTLLIKKKKKMRDMLEDIKGKLEILGSRYELGCVEKKKDNMDTQHGSSGPKVQLGQDDGVKEIGSRLNKPNLCCSKTYYRRRYRAVAKRRATGMLHREQKGTETLPEGSPEVRHPVATDRREQKVPKMSTEGSPESSHPVATDQSEQKGPEMSPELSTEVGCHVANDRREQKGPEMVCREQKGTEMPLEVSPGVRRPVATDRREQKGPEMSPEVIRAVATERREQKGPEISPKLIPEIRSPVESFARDKSGMYGVENEEVLWVGNFEVGEEGLEDIIPETVSRVVDSCLEFYSKMGITCEGKEKNMRKLVECIANGRKQPIVEEGGIATSSRGFDCYVNYDRGMSEVQQVRGRGRGNHGVL